MNGEAAIAGLPILADDLLALWQTLGYSYERLTTGIAPGNAARQGFSAHDHGGGGTGVFLCQPLGRWNGTSDLAANGGQATGLPFGAMASFYCCAVACSTYVQQDAMVFISGTMGGGGINNPEEVGAALSVEWDGTALADVMHYYAAGDVWLIGAAIPCSPQRCRRSSSGASSKCRHDSHACRRRLCYRLADSNGRGLAGSES